jgi:hypothetical protein
MLRWCACENARTIARRRCTSTEARRDVASGHGRDCGDRLTRLGIGHRAVTWRDRWHRIVGKRGGVGVLVIAAEPGQSAKLTAATAYEVLTCKDVDLNALDEYKKAWFADPRSRPAEQ